MKLNKKMFLFLIPLLLALFILSGCGIIPQPPEGKISGRVLIPSSEISKDITGWVPIANAVVTVVDADGVTHTVTTDENGYYAFEGIAVNPNTIITATVGQNGDILVLKDVINQAVAADEDYDAGDMDPESTALALVLEALIAEGIDLSDIDLEEIRASDSFSALVNLVTTVLEEGGDVTKDPDIADLIEDIINPPVPPSPTPKSDTTVTIAVIPGVTAPVALAAPVTAITETDEYTGTVSWSPAHNPFGYSTVYTATITLTPKTGYTFTGVTTDFFTVAGAITTNPANSGVITAVFPETESLENYNYTVTFDSQGSSAVSPVTGIAYNDTITLPEEPTNPPFTFSGWFTEINGGGSEFTSATPVIADITVYAYWTINTYTLTMAVSPEGYGTAADVTPGEPGPDYPASFGVSISAVANEGYEFVNWTAPAGTFTDSTSSSTFFSMPAQDVTVTANFQEIPATTQYTLSLYTYTGGLVKFEGGSANNQVSGKYNEGAVVGIESIPDPDYTGYQFIRWEVNVGDAANVADTGSASTTVTMNEEMELTAILEESTPEEFFTFDSTTGTITAYNFTGGLDVVIPPTIGGIPVEHIGDMAFWDSSNTYNLTSVIIPYGVTSIGNSAFYENNLTSVIIPNSVTSIGNSAFDGNLLPSVDIPDSVTSLGEQAFNDNLLTSIDIPDYVTHIDNYTFGDNLLTTVTIPDLVTTIDTSAFANNQLTSVIIGSAVTTINEWAFNGNTITSITIGAGVNIVDTGYQDTMGEYSEYFKVAYDGGGKLAGTYNYTGIWPDYWVKE